ncbi:MAG: ornithine cyclodeaminase family protein [Pyrinomonadaceae bacterium]
MGVCSPLWISEAEVTSLMNIGDAIQALERGLLAEANGDARNMVKTHVGWGDGATLHAIGAVFPKAGFAGTKTWAHTKAGASPLLVLFDSESGALRAIIEAFALGQMRTASASGLATQWLAVAGAEDFAIIGTGKQAITQVAAVLAVRPIRKIRVFGLNEERRREFAKRVESEFNVETIACNSAADTVVGAQVITLVTRATEPVITAAMIAQGSHINAVGAILPNRAEVSQDLMRRCSEIIVDSVLQAQHLSRELIEFLGDPDEEGWKKVKSLACLLSQRESRRPTDDVTLLKSLGMGISDLSLGIELYGSALANGIGREFPQPKTAPLRLDAAGRE